MTGNVGLSLYLRMILATLGGLALMGMESGLRSMMSSAVMSNMLCSRSGR